MAKNQRLNASITIGSVLEGSVKKNIGFLKSGLGQVGNAIKDVERRQRELAKQRKVLEKEGRSVEDLDREYQDLERTLGKLRRAQERWTNASHAANRVGKTFSAMTTDIGRQARRLAVGGGLAATALAGVTNGTAQAAAEIKAQAEVANTSTREFQRFAAAAETVGIEQDKVSDILKDVNDRVGDFLQTGGGPMADFFENIGPKVGVTADHFRDLNGKDALQLYVSSLEKAGVSQQEMTFYMEAMAGDTTALIPLLRDGGRELERLGDKAEATGQILSDQTIEQSQKFKESTVAFQGVMRGVRNKIGAEFLPLSTELIDKIGGALAKNSDAIGSFASKIADGVRDAVPVIQDLASGVGRVTRTVSQSVTKVAEMVGGWENFGVIIGGVLASGTIMKVVKFGGAVFSLGKAMVGLTGVLPLVAGGIKAIGAALIANPIGIVIAAIAGAAYLIYKNWEPIKAFFLNLWEKVNETFENAKNRIGEIWGGLKQNIADGVAGVKEAWAGVKEGIGSVLDWLASKFEWVMQYITPVINALNTVRNAPGKAGRWVADKLWGGGDEPVQERASGGFFRPGAVLTGEKGPELRYQNRAGFIADNRAMRSLADYAGKVSGIMQGGGMQAAAQAAVTHVHQYTVNAQGVSAQQLIEMLDQRARQASQGGLFDRVPATGMWGR